MVAAVANLVWETSTTTGTGDLTTSRNGGYQRGNEAFGTTDNTTSNPWIFIVNRDAAAAEWEIRQTYWSAAGTLKRTGSPTLSSNSNNAVNFGAGTKDVMSDIPVLYQALLLSAREVLTANRTYYVRTDGSDSNTGLVDSAGGAFLTIQKAIDVAAALDISIYNVTIDVGNGTYTGSTTLKYPIGSGFVSIVGDTSTPTNVVISTTSAPCFEFSTSGTGTYWLQGMKLQTTTGGHGINNTNARATLFWSTLNFGAIAGDQIRVATGRAIMLGNYEISGGADRHFHAREQGFIDIQSAAGTITVSGTPAFAATFAQCQGLSYIFAGSTTFSGAATGSRFITSLNGLINTLGGGANYFPGNSAGTEQTVFDTYV